MLRRVALVRTDVSWEFRASFIRVARIGELETTIAVTSNRHSVRRLLVTASVVPSSPILVTLMKEALSSSETSVLTRATRRNIPGDAILHSHRRENLKSYMPYNLCIVRYLQMAITVKLGAELKPCMKIFCAIQDKSSVTVWPTVLMISLSFL
jgi:hypothetical protein